MNPTKQAKPFNVSKREVYQAWKRVKANQGAAGVDGENLEMFEGKLSANLYKLWNRMASGSYFPKAVRRVEIPKKDGGKRPLGIPTIFDRVAQEVVRAQLEKKVDPFFHEDSYGYRPGKSAIDAVAKCRQRSWKSDWVLDIDIQKFFDTVNHELLMKAVRKHVSEKWIVLYIERWLKAPIRKEDGSEQPSECGTPQGGVISPVLANLYLHYAFDLWMSRQHPTVPFERYADDIVVHCKTEAQAEALREQLEQRFAECKLTLHPTKTQIVYCKDSNRKLEYPRISFTFLGYTFRPRAAKGRTSVFTSFLPAVSQQAARYFRQKIRETKLKRFTLLAIDELARVLNPMIRGWFQYFAHFHKSALYSTFRYMQYRLARWIRQKYRLRKYAAMHMLDAIRRTNPKLFAHWQWFPIG
jgi:group II intron reverse transcriptase/maturase